MSVAASDPGCRAARPVRRRRRRGLRLPAAPAAATAPSPRTSRRRCSWAPSTPSSGAPSPTVTTAWLIGIARHKLVDHWRRVEREQRRLQAVADEPAPPTPTTTRGTPTSTCSPPATPSSGSAPTTARRSRCATSTACRVPEVADVLGRTVHATEALLVRARRAFRDVYETGSRRCGRDERSVRAAPRRTTSRPAPTPRFVARLRGPRRAPRSTSDRLPTIPLPERTTTMTDTADHHRATVDARPPYICVSPAADAIAWYGDVLGAVETIRYTGDDGRIGHAELDIAGAQVMLSDEYPELGVRGADVDRRHAGDAAPRGARRRRHLRAGRRRRRPARPAPPEDEAYGARSFSMIDPFGHRWMVQTPIGTPTPRGAAGAACEGYTITAPPAATPAAARRRARLLHARRAGHGGGRPLLRRAVRVDDRAGQRRRGVRPRRQHQAAARVHARARPTSRRCCTSGSTTSPPTRRGSRELGGEVLSETTYDSGPQRRVRRRPGPPVRALAAGAGLRVSERSDVTARSRPRRSAADEVGASRGRCRVTTTSFVAEVDGDRLDTGDLGHLGAHGALAVAAASCRAR